MGERITQTEAGRRLGVSQQAISRHVRSGLLPTVNGKIDVDVAALVLGKCLDPGRSKIVRNSARRPENDSSTGPAELADRLAGDDPLTRIPSPDRMSFETARMIEKRYQALEAKASYEERMGRLVPIADIEPAMSAAIVSAREYLLGCSRKLARDIQGLSIPDAAALIEAAHTEALRRLSQWRPGESDTDQDDDDFDPAVTADPFEWPDGE